MRDRHVAIIASEPVATILDPNAKSFTYRDENLVHRGVLVPNLDIDWQIVQNLHEGDVGQLSGNNVETWQHSTSARDSVSISHRRGVRISQHSLPFPTTGDALMSGFTIPAKPVMKVSSLQDRLVHMPFGTFIDKVLPPPSHSLITRERFDGDYFVSLHNIVSAAGMRGDGSVYPEYTPNHLGARIKLAHTGLKPDRWRYHLLGYEHAELVQFIEHGFPLGLGELPALESSTRNHGSSYGFYTHVDKFVTEELINGGLAGPFQKAPWWDSVVSPLMTAPKKPDSRRTVFDATYGENSLNNATPSDCYLGQPCIYTFPKLEDFRKLVFRCGRYSFLWKRDLSRFFLQIPMDPNEYHRVCLVWRGLVFFFLGLAFGLRHSGLQGQRLTDAVSWIHRRRGLETCDESMFNVVNYSDDLGGVEETEARALESFSLLATLFEDLGLDESLKKAEKPCHQMVYLGVMFDSVAMEMRVPPDKLSEIKAEIKLWTRKTTITKRNLQSLLGKLFWVAKVVKFARVFMGRLLQQLRTMGNSKDTFKVKLNDESRKDLKWWERYLDHFNGIQLIVDEDPFLLNLDQMMDRPADLCAGDATPTGAGAWHDKFFWSRELPDLLKDPKTPIHLKEFWAVIVSARLWGDSWSGRSVVIWCDNDAVVDTIVHKKPRDPALLSLLREFLHIVVTKKFFPVLRKIGTKENSLADFISRRHDTEAAIIEFSKVGMHDMIPVSVTDSSFKLTEPW